MRIGSGGAQGVTVLQSDKGQFRNIDFVVDQEKAYLTSTQQTAAGGQLPHLQLFNPAGSGIKVLVDKIYIYCDAAALVEIGVYNTELTTDGGAWGPMKLGGAAGLAHYRKQDNAVDLVSGWDKQYVNAGESRLLVYSTPWELDEGIGLTLSATAAASTLRFTIFGREV